MVNIYDFDQINFITHGERSQFAYRRLQDATIVAIDVLNSPNFEYTRHKRIKNITRVSSFLVKTNVSPQMLHQLCRLRQRQTT